jgi:V-type H+-transporting ATPase subunit F
VVKLSRTAGREKMALDAAGKLIAVIGDEDTVTGFLLAGIGHRTTESTNFLVVKPGKECVQL